jgi:DNA repair exonuclease SbcCD ATPase subunit
MFRILNATICNFLTIGQVSQTIGLAVDGLTLVLGENLDVSGANSRNGVGKTAILQAICYALFGKPLTKIRLDNLVNNVNTKAMLVTLDFEVNGKSYRIERGRKPALLRFYKDGVVHKDNDEALGENKHTQAEIERIIGLSHTLFRHVVALNTFTTPFLREEVSVQREVIEELFGITQLSQRAETLKKLIDVTKDEMRTAEANLKASTESNARIEQGIDRAVAEAMTWRSMQDRQIADLIAKAESTQAIDIEGEIAAFDRIDLWQQQQGEIVARQRTTEARLATLAQEGERLRKSLIRAEAEAQASDGGEIERLEVQAQLFRTEADKDIQPQIDRLRSEIVRRQQESASKFAEANQLVIELSEIMDRLAQPDSHRCVTCGQGLAGTDHLEKVVANLSRQEQHLSEKISRLLAEHEQADRDVAKAEAEIDGLVDNHRNHRDYLLAKVAAVQMEIGRVAKSLAERREAATQQADELRIELAELDYDQRALVAIDVPDLGPRPASRYPSRDAVWQVRQERDQLLQQLETAIDKPNPHETKIEALRAALVAIDYAALNDLNTRFKHETFLHKLLTAKDSFIRKKIIDQNLSYLNKRLDHYLQRLGLLHEVAFLADLTVEISLLGIAFDFEQLSRGEMNRVILANSWAFRDVWQNLNHALSLMFCDEILDQGTDGAGIEAAFAILKEMGAEGQNIFLISHREELRDEIDKVLLVRKEHGFTNFVLS